MAKKSETPATPAKVVKKVAKKASVSTPVVEAAPAPTVVAPVENTVVESDDFVQEFSLFAKRIQETIGMLSTLKSEFKVLEKKYTKELKLARKASLKKRRNAGNRAPSGFVRPTLVTDELAAFL